MKNRFIQYLSILCAVMLLCAFGGMAAAESVATPTDLGPAEDNDGADGEEIIITKALKIGESWEGKLKKVAPTVLKLDLGKSQTVHMVILGRNVWATVEKVGRTMDDMPRTETDPDTRRAIVSWEAEPGSYLITLGPVEPNKFAKTEVLFLDDEGFAAWEAENEADDTEQPDEEPDQEPETDPDDENGPESEKLPERHITVDIAWDVPDPVIGDTAHFIANLEGYDGLQYTMQWQYSPDDSTWFDLPGETGQTMDVVITEENNIVYWRILVYVEQNQDI